MDKKQPKNPSDFKVGEIYLMKVASRSHVKSPYYVEIIQVGKDFIETSIPEYHSAIITQKDNTGLPNWDYHIPRFEFVGTKSTHGHLLKNQKGLVKQIIYETSK